MLAEGPLGQGRPHRPGVVALDGDLHAVSPQDGQVSRRAGVVEQEGAVHQGIVGHLRERKGLTLPASSAPGVPGKGLGGRGCWKWRAHRPWAQSPLADLWERLHRRPLHTWFHCKIGTPPRGSGSAPCHQQAKPCDQRPWVRAPVSSCCPPPRDTYTVSFSRGRPGGQENP